jgi:hypothetical protein
MRAANSLPRSLNEHAKCKQAACRYGKQTAGETNLPVPSLGGGAPISTEGLSATLIIHIRKIREADRAAFG